MDGREAEKDGATTKRATKKKSLRRCFERSMVGEIKKEVKLALTEAMRTEWVALLFEGGGPKVCN